MNGPVGVFSAWAPGIPMAAGICRAAPFTNTVRCTWMWYTVCSAVSQLIPSTVFPVAELAELASAGAAGTGTASGPLGPGEGSGFSVPSVLSEASLSFGVPPVALAGLPLLLLLLLLLVTARVMATAAMITTTAAP